MNIFEINNNIYYVGVNDRIGMTSYNSYLINDERKVLIDLVPNQFLNIFLYNIKSEIGDRKIEYLVLHDYPTECMDSLSAIINSYPEILISTTSAIADYIKKYNSNFPQSQILPLSDNNILNIGENRNLKLISTVDNKMISLDLLSGILFSGTIFCCFGTLNGGLIDREIDIESYIPEAFKYFASVTATVPNLVQNVLQQLKGENINSICPHHGPIWKDYVMHMIDLYDRLSRNQTENGVVLVYDSNLNVHQQITELLARVFTLKKVTVKEHYINVYNESTITPENSNISHILSDIIRYKGIIICTSSQNGTISPSLNNLLDALAERNILNRVISILGIRDWDPVTADIATSKVKHLEWTSLLPTHNVCPISLSKAEEIVDVFTDSFIDKLK